MMKLNRFKIKWREFRSVLMKEYRHIFSDAGVILVMIIALILYSTVYSLAYKNQVLRDIPIAVIDNSQSPSSRKLIETFDALPNIFVSYKPTNMDQAKDLFFDHKINGIVYIGHDYEKKLMRSEQAVVGVYVDASFFLMYRQVFIDVVGGITGVGARVEMLRLLSSGVSEPMAEVTVDPVGFDIKNLFNPYGGYGSFVMPAIIIIIIQQTLLIGIGMIGGTWREQGVYKELCTPGERRLSTVPIVLGKCVAYLSIYVVTVFYILGFHYKMFGYPMNGSFVNILAFMLPYMLSCIFLGIAISTLFRYRENSLLFLLWCSIPFLLLSGASIPREAIPEWLYTMGKVLPSSDGVSGFLKIQTMGANLNDVSEQLNWLWILTGVYFVLACLGIRRVQSITRAEEMVENNK